MHRTLFALLALSIFALGIAACGEGNDPGTLLRETIITASGDTIVLDCEEEDDWSSFPTLVLDLVADSFPDYSVDEAGLCDGDGTVYYWFELESDLDEEDEIEIAVDASGIWYFVEDDDDDDDDGEDFEAVINLLGDTIAVDCDEEIAFAALPLVVQDSVNTTYPGWEVDEAETCDGTGGPYYLIELEDGDDELDVAFDALGQELGYIEEH